MARTFPTQIPIHQAAWLAVPCVALTAWVALRVGAELPALVFALTALVLLCWNGYLHRRIARSAMRLGSAVGPLGARATLEAAVAVVEQRLATTQHRQLPTHPVSGLPMREALLARIESDGRGLLATIAFVDFERLTAFDPARGERVFAALTARLRRMMPPETRFIAQIDRGHVGIWFGETCDEACARAELDAVAYALGDAILDDGREIIPQVQIRLAAFDRAEALTPATFLSRALASIALARGASPADTSPIDLADIARDQYSLEQDLRQAIARRELVLDFQPLVDAAKQRVCGAEALLRWHHPERGLVSPGRFVPLLEAAGLAVEIGTWVLNAAVREAGEWQARGLADLRMAVNVSALQLEGDDLPMLVERTLQRHSTTAAALEIELTESVATSNAEHCCRMFDQLRAAGIKLAVDDFGTGYSGFSSLRTLRFDKLKIDREFITSVDKRPDSQAICRSIIALGRGLDIRVLAEGVERHEEYAWLRRHGCDHFQGYYFSPPLDADRFAAFVRDTSGLANLLAPQAGRSAILERLSA